MITHDESIETHLPVDPQNPLKYVLQSSLPTSGPSSGDQLSQRHSSQTQRAQALNY